MTKQDNTKRKKSVILVVLLLLLVVTIVGYTYSRYMSSGTADSTATVAKWSVKIDNNDLDTYKSTPLEAPLTLDTNPYVDEGVIAPGSSGSYTVEIDPTGSQVAIDYVVKVSGIKGLTTANDNIKVTSAKYWIGEVAGEGTNALVDGENGVTITESLAQVKNNEKLTVKVTIEWENVEANNDTDTSNGKESETVTVSTSITAKQHLTTD